MHTSYQVIWARKDYKKKAEELYHWANLKVDICKYVKKCVTCQRFKGDTGLQQQWKELPPVSKPP